MRAVLTVLVALAVLGDGQALASDDGDREAARAAIARQQEAFRRDDPAGAYAEASPAIKDMFGDPAVFLGMVRDSYKPVFRNRSFTFDKAEDLPDGSLVQGVRIQDPDGVDWVALYTLERQPDGSWKITGCRLTKATGVNT